MGAWSLENKNDIRLLLFRMLLEVASSMNHLSQNRDRPRISL